MNSPSFLGAEITRKTCISTGKTQRKHKGVLRVPDLRTVYQKGRATPERSSQQLRAAEWSGTQTTPCDRRSCVPALLRQRQQLLSVPPSSPLPASSGAGQGLHANASPARAASAGREACAPAAQRTCPRARRWLRYANTRCNDSSIDVSEELHVIKCSSTNETWEFQVQKRQATSNPSPSKQSQKCTWVPFWN